MAHTKCPCVPRTFTVYQLYLNLLATYIATSSSIATSTSTSTSTSSVRLTFALRFIMCHSALINRHYKPGHVLHQHAQNCRISISELHDLHQLILEYPAPLQSSTHGSLYGLPPLLQQQNA